MTGAASERLPRGKGGWLRPSRPPRGRVALAALAAVAAVLLGVAPALADGDPASDYLLQQNVFLPYEAPSAAASQALEQAVANVYVHGNRVKVALIYSADDLGSVPSLYGHPSDYARFLGLELGLWYAGPLLVVMPAGFGIYDGGRSTSAEQAILQGIAVAAGSPDDLALTATTALDALESAGALDSPDVKPPLVTVYPAKAVRGKPASLHFDLYDDSGTAQAVVRVYEAGALVATLNSPPASSAATRPVTVRWLVPRELRSRQLRFCVVATDPSGNRSAPACASFLDVR